MEAFYEQTTQNGIRLLVLPTRKFKTITAELYIHASLGPEAAKLAVLPQVLLRGTEKYPDLQLIQRELDGLYGAEMRRSMLKKGERQLLNLKLELPDARYLGEAKPAWGKGLDLLAEVLLRPKLENGCFIDTYVNQEKENLAQQIKSLINDKRVYALKRCTEEMCRHERYRYYQYGNEEALAELTPAGLYDYYRRVLGENPLEIYLVGDIEVEAAVGAVEERFAFPRAAAQELQPTEVRTEPARPETLVETQPVSQGKLVIGYRTGTTIQDEDYEALMVYNSVLGGGGTSKLFMNVREKASLAYYASAQLEAVKGLLFINAGIEAGNFDRAVDIIDRQVDEIRAGNVSADELNQSKRLLVQSMQKAGDVPSGLISFAVLNRISGRQRSLEEVTAAIERVRVDDVVRVGQRLKKDMTYFLRNAEGSGGSGGERDA